MAGWQNLSPHHLHTPSPLHHMLAEGTSKLIIRAGIKENGINNTRTAYPFYNAIIVNHNFVPAKTDTFNPVINYLGKSVKYVLLEDFESASIEFEEGFKNSALLTREEKSDLIF
ncbi:MAG: hypothetical protein R6X34_18800, partial [Chloroflexota bacterium]